MAGGVHWLSCQTRRRRRGREPRTVASDRKGRDVSPDKTDNLGDVEPKPRKKLDDAAYLKELGKLQIELVKLQEWIRTSMSRTELVPMSMKPTT